MDHREGSGAASQIKLSLDASRQCLFKRLFLGVYVFFNQSLNKGKLKSGCETLESYLTQVHSVVLLTLFLGFSVTLNEGQKNKSD